jgi:hypothetical protein
MGIPALDPNVRDWIQATSWVVAVAAGIFGIGKIVVELRAAREQRAQELRWRKAQAAKVLNDELLSDDDAQAALTMLDWDGREFELKPGVVDTITEPEMLASLRTVSTRFSDKEAFVRDAFDGLFYYLGVLEHNVRGCLVDFSDLEYPAEYYVKLLAKHRTVFETYLSTYGFSRASTFLDRFPAWYGAVGVPVKDTVGK